MATSTSTEPFFICLTIFAVISLGAAAPGSSTPPITRSARDHMLLDASMVEWTVLQLRAELQVEFVEPVQRHIEDRDMRLQAHRHARGIGADHAAAQDHDLGRPARPARRPAACRGRRRDLQAMRAGLDRHAAGHFAHRRQQRQAAARIGDGFIGDAR